jgi:N6-adenosine-specific RNA methylase IME4|tara:strand:- start:15 stop:554 length:540 start_codon:yes stop_codon:yes gene_type:complete
MIPFPDKTYDVIYADPAWYFKTYSKKGNGRSPEQHYSCMSINDICNLPIDSISNPNCVLLLWAIDPMLPQAFKVIESWGFKYKTVAFTWAKTNKKSEGFFTGLGYWTRGNPEMCLLATRGKPKRISKSVKQLVVDRRREHSRKPDRIRDDIVQLCGDVSRIELFARQKTEGWDSWGNEV